MKRKSYLLAAAKGCCPLAVTHAVRTLQSTRPPIHRKKIRVMATWLVAGLACLDVSGEHALAQSSVPAVNVVNIANQAWSRWDRNQDNTIDRREIVAVLRNPKTKGYEASLAAALYQSKFFDAPKDKPFSVSKEELLALAGKSNFIGNVQRGNERLSSIERVLFAEGDPSIDNFHQGREDDCFLLANIALLVKYHPDEFRTMFTVLGNGNIRLTLGGGQTATISPLTDGEILLGADPGPGHGLWLPAFEKAFGLIRYNEKEKLFNRAGLTYSEAISEAMFSLINAGGLSVPTMQELTGHKAIGDAVIFGKESKDRAAQREKVHALLTKLMAEKKEVLLHTRRNPDKGLTFVKPPGWPDAHTYALFGYDTTTRLVHCFNPWGNDFTPKGEPGLKNGYLTKKGQFDIPLDDFMALYRSFSYETSQAITATVRN